MSDSTIPTTQKQRRFARADVNIDTRYERGDATKSVQGSILNLGGGGVRIASAEDLPPDEVLTIHFRIPTLEHELTLRGKVVLSFYDAARAAYLHGVAFTQAVPSDQAAIVSYVESIDHEASDEVD